MILQDCKGVKKRKVTSIPIKYNKQSYHKYSEIVHNASGKKYFYNLFSKYIFEFNIFISS